MAKKKNTKKKTTEGVINEIPPVDKNVLIDSPVTEETALIDVPPVKEALVDTPPVEIKELILEDATLVESKNSNDPVVYAPYSTGRAPRAKPRTTKKGEDSTKLTSAQIKKLRGEYSKRTLRSRFGIEF